MRTMCPMCGAVNSIKRLRDFAIEIPKAKVGKIIWVVDIPDIPIITPVKL
jgi:hypothetical protein